MERDLADWLKYENVINFNSHAHVERDFVNKFGERDFYISTHTLTWSVTILAKRHINHANISTHTLTWSVTVLFVITSRKDNISTHTLTWSVTLDIVYIWCLLNVMRTYFFI